ncbi:putative membrane protein [Campylobacter iguaniorum]|uniref:hypothetical protein n=1 Tax=Campylobacter iguaniorum TaxID=1244531 RepID=UPI00073A4A5F|nr:hypothetical protein [Campylobacter iguaniorum]ALV25384.1 putative membrane protein [Campylobacter iguaniorum]
MSINIKIFIILAVLVTFPILFLDSGRWDGSIVNMAFKFENLAPLQIWFSESRWDLQYYLYVFCFELSQITHINTDIFVKIITIFSVIGVAWEIKNLAINLLNLDKNFAYFAGFLALAYPAWHVLTSSVMVIHIFCFYCLLFGFRIIQKYKLFGILFILASFQLNSNFTLLCGLIFSTFISKKYLQNQNPNIVKYVIFIILTIAIFICYKYFFPPYGIYEGYNSIKPRFFGMLGAFIYFGAFALPILIMAFIAFLIQFKSNPINKSIVISLFIIATLAFCAIVPYVFVSKSPGNFIVFLKGLDTVYGDRQALLLVVATSLFCGYTFSITKNLKPNLLASITLFISFILLFLGYYQKAKGEVYNNAIILALKQTSMPPNSIINLSYASDMPIYIKKNLSFYEFNSLLCRAYNKCGWYVIKPSEENEDFHKFSLAPKYIAGYNAKDVDVNTRINLNIEQVENINFLDILFLKQKNIFKLYQ